jgi:hypothetical protein
MQYAEVIQLQATTIDELEPLEGTLAASEIAAVREHGWAAYLFDGPRLELRLSAGNCPRGAAVVQAAIWSPLVVVDRAGLGVASSVARELDRDELIDH